MKAVTPTPTTLLCISFCLALAGVGAQTISQPQATLPVQNNSDDPLISSSYSAAFCSLKAILGTESAPHGIGPLTVQPNCMSMTLQSHSTATVNGQSLPSSGLVTIFEPTGSSSVAISSARPTTAPLVSSSSASATTSSSRSTAASSTASSAQTNAASPHARPPAAAGWIAKHNIGVLLFTTFALLAGVTYFLDELLAMLV